MFTYTIDSYDIKQYEGKRVCSRVELWGEVSPKLTHVLAYVESLQANCSVPVKDLRPLVDDVNS